MDILKESPLYYERLFAEAGIEPSGAMVVDDRLHVLAWAKEIGAITVLVGESAEGADGFDAVIARLAELPALLRAATPA